MSISPQGYTLGGDPQNINPFWGEDEQTNWTIEAEATVDNTSGSPSVNVETETDTTTKTKTFTFEFSGLKGETGATGQTGATGATGATGETGNGIQNIAKTGTSGLVDTYTITFTDGTTTTFTVTNGADGEDGATGATGATGNGIASITKTGTSGLVDTYTITFTDGTTTTFTVTNGSSSGGSTVSVTQVLSTGTKIASITVDGVTTDLYAPNSGGGGSGTIDGDATVKWAGEALTSQPSTYPYKWSRGVTTQATSGNTTFTGTYYISDLSKTVTVTFDVAYDLTAGEMSQTRVYHAAGISDSTQSQTYSISFSLNSLPSTDDQDVNVYSDYQISSGTISGVNLMAYRPSSIVFEYNSQQYTGYNTNETLGVLVASNVATSFSTYDVMEAIGIGLVVNESDFTDIVGQVINKLRCTFENATYYIQQIPYIKISDSTTGSMQITAGAGILYFDNMEFNAVSNQVWGHGMLRVVVPNSGGEYDFQGAIGLQCTDANSISITLGRGTLTHSGGDVYITTGSASAFTVNKITCTLSAVYAEVI